VNTVEYAREIAGGPVYGVIGGLHLFREGRDVAWTAEKLHARGWSICWARIVPASRRYPDPSARRLTRKTAVVGAVGASFDSDRGIDPLALAQ